MLHVIWFPAPTAQLPSFAPGPSKVAETVVNASWRLSLTTTPVAAALPVFVTVIV